MTVAFTGVAGVAVRAGAEDAFAPGRAIAVAIAGLVVVPNADSFPGGCLHANMVVGAVAVATAFISQKLIGPTEGGPDHHRDQDKSVHGAPSGGTKRDPESESFLMSNETVTRRPETFFTALRGHPKASYTKPSWKKRGSIRLGLFSAFIAVIFAWSATTAGRDSFAHLFATADSATTAAAPATCHDQASELAGESHSESSDTAGGPEDHKSGGGHGPDCHDCVCCNGFQVLPKARVHVVATGQYVIELHNADRTTHFFDPGFFLLRPPISLS